MRLMKWRANTRKEKGAKMLYKSKDSYREMERIQKQYSKAFRIPKQGKLLYHYTTMETVWKILESGSMLARNIRFSNDSKEYLLGGEKIREYICKKSNNSNDKKIEQCIQANIQNYYMICFCEKGDLLSQWRGYANDGVSLGMDFLEEEGECTHSEMFTLLNNKENRGGGSSVYGLCDEEKVHFLQMPYQVFYIDKENAKLKEAMNSFLDADLKTNLLFDLIPFIKDDGFDEEKEYRILFDASDMGGTQAENRVILSHKIWYIEKEGRKIPNIAVELGNAKTKEEKVQHVLFGNSVFAQVRKQGKDPTELEKILREQLAKENVTISVSEGKKHVYIGEGNNQEEMMRIVEDLLQENGVNIAYDKGIKIWCRGRLPIRKIIVGPGEQQKRTQESLQYFARNTFWLRYVDIENSKIPLQK